MNVDTDRRQLVLVLLSTEQREARSAELGLFRRPGIELKFEESPEVGLDLAKSSPPALVIVGMTLGAIEGLEFVALLMRARPNFPGKIVVLPDKGDPFPPVVHARDPATGKSITESIDVAGIERLISTLAASAHPVAPEPPAQASPQPVATPAISNAPAASSTAAAPSPAASPPAASPPAASPPAASPTAASSKAAAAGARPAQAPSRGVTAPLPRPDVQPARSPSGGARPAPAPAPRPQVQAAASPSVAARDAVSLAQRPAPWKAASAQVLIQNATARVSPVEVQGQQASPASGVQPSASPPHAEVRQGRADSSEPDWLSRAPTIPVPRSKEPIPVAPAVLAAAAAPPAAPAQQVPPQPPSAPEPRAEEPHRTSTVVASPISPPPEVFARPAVGSPSLALTENAAQPNTPNLVAAGKEQLVRVRARALAWWSTKGPRERLTVAVVAIGVFVLVSALAAVATCARPSNAVPDTETSPQNSHN
jgi:hypothetical protein